ncbi:MAG: hypothetical protein A2074_00180 [Candidatus Aquicultor primus]|uniref:DUF4160 domain-containing protein n=1 Tax=Candidatus Aquicultor primus TaxID=1797195 RepID=A0A1F2UHS2_9ACTN|nr:MAG: hypothetical protein A2074_00180 [Candidatus Aquicultor primus]
MPIISMFYGIIVYMYCERNAQHMKSHLHAEYQGEEVVVALDGEVINGEIPNKQLKLLLAWMAIHEDELNANWQLLSDGLDYFKIEPLR